MIQAQELLNELIDIQEWKTKLDNMKLTLNTLKANLEIIRR